MNCNRFEVELEKLGTLKTLETDPAFGEHLKVCPDCQVKRTEYVRLFETLAFDQPSMPDDTYWAAFPALVRERVEKSNNHPRWKPILGWSLPIATLFLVAGVAFFVPKKQTNVANLTTEEAFNYVNGTRETAADLPLPENTLTSVAAQAEEELVGTLKVEELVYTLSEEQLKTLEEKLTHFKL